MKEKKHEVWSLVVSDEVDAQRIRLTGHGLPQMAREGWRRVTLAGETGDKLTALYPVSKKKPNGFGLRAKKVKFRESGKAEVAGKEYLVVEIEEAASLARSVPMTERNMTGRPSEVIVVVPGPEDLSKVVYSSLMLGSNSMTMLQRDGDTLLRISDPSMFLVEEWTLKGYPVYEPVSRSVWRIVGLDHPWQKELHVSDSRAMALASHSTWIEVDELSFRDVFSLIDLDVSLERIDTRETDPDRISIPVRLGIAESVQEPELWVLEKDDLHRLEALLATLPSSDLASLRLACLRPKGGGDDVFALRESLVGGVGSQYLDFGTAYASVPGVPTLHIPVNRCLEPPLVSRLLVKLFNARAGIFSLVVPTEDDTMSLVEIPSASFRTVTSLVDYLILGSTMRLAGVLERSVLDIGQYATLPNRPVVEVHQQQASKVVKKQTRKQEETSETEEDETFEDLQDEEEEDDLLEEVEEIEEVQVEERPVSNTEMLEAESLAVENLEDSEAWEKLGVMKLSQRAEASLEEAVSCLDHAWWLLDTTGRERIERLVQEKVCSEKNVPEHLSLRQEISDLEPEDVEKITSVVARLRSIENTVPKKARWILWSLLLSKFPDDIEQERVKGATLQDLGMFGVSEQDSFPFVRRYLRQSLSRQVSREFIPFFEGLEEQAARMDTESRLEILGRVATARVLAGDADGARKFVSSQQATNALITEASTVAACAACFALLGEGDAVKMFHSAFDLLDRQEEGWSKDKTVVQVLSQLRIASIFGHEEDFLQRLDTIFERQPIRRRAILLHDSAEHMVDLGGSSLCQERVESLLKEQVIYSDPYYINRCLKTFQVSLSGRPIPTDITGSIVSRLLDRRSIDGPTIGALSMCLNRESEASILDQIRGRIESLGDGVGKDLLRSTLVKGLVVFGHTDEALSLLSRCAGSVWQYTGTAPADILRHLLPCVGYIGRVEGVEIINNALAAMRKSQLRARNQGEILNAASKAVLQLGREDLAIGVLERIVEEFTRVTSNPNANVSYLFEVLGLIVTQVSSYHDQERCIELVKRAVDLSDSRISQGRTTTVDHPFFLYYSRLKGAVALFSLGAFDEGMKCLSSTARRLSRVSVLDRKDISDLCLEGIRALSLSSTDTDKRVQLLNVLVKAGLGNDGGYGRSQGPDMNRRNLLIGALDEVVYHDSAYRVKLGQIRAREERIIRDELLSQVE